MEIKILIRDYQKPYLYQQIHFISFENYIISILFDKINNSFMRIHQSHKILS